MHAFTPQPWLTAVFVGLTLLLVARVLYLVREVAPVAHRARWVGLASAAAVAWLAVHAGVAASGVLALPTTPPLTLVYLFVALIIGTVTAFSPVGSRLSTLPLPVLVGVNFFRLPLEVILHKLYEGGDLPIQMTWSGLNFDVITGITAIVIWRWPGEVKEAVIWAWNLMGMGFLVTVVSIAMLSSPLPIRTFLNDPPVLLVFDMPFNWVPTVHVWIAWVSHLILFRALFARRRHATS